MKKLITEGRRMVRVRTYGQVTYMWMWIRSRNNRWRSRNKAHGMINPQMIKMLRRRHRDLLVYIRKLERETEKRGNRWRKVKGQRR